MMNLSAVSESGRYIFKPVRTQLCFSVETML